MFNHIDIRDIVSIAKEAGNGIMKVYKQDSSPLTLADKKANNILKMA